MASSSKILSKPAQSKGMLRMLVFVLLSCFLSEATAQDTLRFRDGAEQLVRVLEASKTYVRYTAWPVETDAPVTVKGSAVIEQVRYQNGTVLNLAYQEIRYTMDSLPDLFSFIGLDVLDLAYPQAISVVFQHPIGTSDLTLRLGASTSLHYLTAPEQDANYSYYYYDYHNSSARMFEISAEVLSDNRMSRGWYGGMGVDFGMINLTTDLYTQNGYRDTTLYDIPYGSFYFTGGYYRDFESGLVFGASTNLGLSMQKRVYGINYGNGADEITSYLSLPMVVRFNVILGYRLRI